MKTTRKTIPTEVYLVKIEDPYSPYFDGYKLCTKQSVVMQVSYNKETNKHRARFPNTFKGNERKLTVLRAPVVAQWDDVTDLFIKSDTI